jgi:hypothetical protein
MNARRFIRLLEIVDNGRYMCDLATGTILGTRREPLKPRVNERGYGVVDLYKNGKAYKYKAHEIVSFFGGLDILDRQVNHVNGVKTDNRLVNLEGVTAAENVRHAIQTGLRNNTGKNHANSKLNKDEGISANCMGDIL